MPQLVSQLCTQCRERICSIEDGVWCPHCGKPIHHACLPLHLASLHPNTAAATSEKPESSTAHDPRAVTPISSQQTGESEDGVAEADASNPSSDVAFSESSHRDLNVEIRDLLVTLTPRVYVSWSLIAINFSVLGLMALSGVDPFLPKVEQAMRWGANFGPKTLNGEWWRIVTCTFLHFGIVHLFLNMWAMEAVGPLVERMVGNFAFLVLYMIAGVSGSLASLLWNPHVVGAGASGAIFGVYGALIAILLRNRQAIPTQALKKLQKSGMGFLGYNLLFGMMMPGIDSAAHIGGLIGGFFSGIAFAKSFTPLGVAERPRRNASVACCGVLLLIFGFVAVKTRHPDVEDLFQGTVMHDNLEVSFGEGVSKRDAYDLADYFNKSFGVSKERRSLGIVKKDNRYHLYILAAKNVREDPKRDIEFEFTSARISRDHLHGSAVDTHVCDESFKTIKVMPHSPNFRFGVVNGSIEIWFSQEGERASAMELGQYLTTLFKEPHQLMTYQVHETEDVMDVSMVINKESLYDARMNVKFQSFAKDLSRDVFKGRKVKLHLCDPHMVELLVLDG